MLRRSCLPLTITWLLLGMGLLLFTQAKEPMKTNTASSAKKRGSGTHHIQDKQTGGSGRSGRMVTVNVKVCILTGCKPKGGSKGLSFRLDGDNIQTPWYALTKSEFSEFQANQYECFFVDRVEVLDSEINAVTITQTSTYDDFQVIFLDLHNYWGRGIKSRFSGPGPVTLSYVNVQLHQVQYQGAPDVSKRCKSGAWSPRHQHAAWGLLAVAMVLVV